MHLHVYLCSCSCVCVCVCVCTCMHCVYIYTHKQLARRHMCPHFIYTDTKQLHKYVAHGWTQMYIYYNRGVHRFPFFSHCVLWEQLLWLPQTPLVYSSRFCRAFEIAYVLIFSAIAQPCLVGIISSFLHANEDFVVGLFWRSFFVAMSRQGTLGHQHLFDRGLDVAKQVTFKTRGKGPGEGE